MSGKRDPPVLGDTSSIYHAAASSKGTEINCNSLVQQKQKQFKINCPFLFSYENGPIILCVMVMVPFSPG